MKEQKGQSHVVGGLIWTFGERITAQLVSTLVTVVLARILSPDHYGIISLVTVFISFCNVFVSSGFGSAIVRKPNVRKADYNTAFAVNLSMSLFLYLVLFFLAPFVSSFYRMPELIPVTRVMALRLPLAALNSVQQAYIQRAMAFKRFFVATLLGTVISGIVGIVMAVYGFGVWALVAQYLTNTTVDTLVLSFVGGWKPGKDLSKESAREIFTFGWKVLVSELVATLQNDIKSLIIGKTFGASDLAFFDQGKKYPSLLVVNINTSINKVMLPAYSRLQKNTADLKALLRKSIHIGLFFIMPMMIGFAAVSRTFISVVLTDKWLPCVVYLQIFCLYYLTRPLESSCQQALLAIGRSDVTLRIMLMINIPSFILLIVTALIMHNMFFLALSSIITTLISFVSYMIYSKKLLDYTFREQLSDILPIAVATGIMCIAVLVLERLPLSDTWLLLLQVSVGSIVYLASAVLLKMRALSYITSKLKKLHG